MDPKELKALWEKQDAELKEVLKKAEEETKSLGKMSTETKEAVEKLAKQADDSMKRLLAIEQKLDAKGEGGRETPKTIGELFIESKGYEALKSGAGNSGKINVGSVFGVNTKTNVVNATGQNQPLVADQRVPGIISPGLRRLTIRDLIPSLPTQSNLIQYVKETGFTNAAAMQTSEGAAKAESALTFALSNAAVQTLAHWIPASTQILDDAPALQGYIETRLRYGLKLVEEDQLLNGTGSGVNLSGLIANSTTMNTGFAATGSDTFIDTLLHAKTQVEMNYFAPTGYILNPRDWETIQLIKTTGTSSSGQYIFADPHSVQPASIWGLPVVSTQSMAQGQFLCGAFDIAATIWDRMNATVDISREHSDFFTRNLVAIRVEERLALTVYNQLALVYGGFPFGS